MQDTLGGHVPQAPRCFLGVPLLPFYISEPLTPAEITIEGLAFAAEVAATRPSWQIALTGALTALGGVS